MTAGPPLEPGPGETCDRLSRTLRILQRRRGHRATSDDVLVAWAGVEAAPEARRVLDLGTGKGTVALLMARALPAARIVGVEALPMSQALAVRNAALNDLQDRFDPRLGDLRDPAVLADEAPFDLVTGAPPFMPVGTGVLPRDPQRAAGRFELRGGVADYAACAVDHLAEDGRLVLLMDGRGEPRLPEAFEAAALHLHRIVRIGPRPDRPATYSIGIGGRQPATCGTERLDMRPASGDRWTPAYGAIRQRLDLD